MSLLSLRLAVAVIDAAGAESLLAGAVASIVADINAALTLTNPDEGKCGLDPVVNCTSCVP